MEYFHLLFLCFKKLKYDCGFYLIGFGYCFFDFHVEFLHEIVCERLSNGLEKLSLVCQVFGNTMFTKYKTFWQILFSCPDRYCKFS